MAVMKKHLTPLTKGGQVTKFAGKGSEQAPLPARSAMTALASAPNASMNDYSKASPISQPAGAPAADGLGSGSFAGISG